MCHENEEWCRNWSELDLSIQNWYEEFDDFSPEHLKISKMCTLMGYFWPKYIMFELKKVQRSYIWLHWRLIQNLKENWLVLSKITWKIWQIFVHMLKSSKCFQPDWQDTVWKLYFTLKINEFNQTDKLQCENFILPWK